jgi:hypothetical protein
MLTHRCPCAGDLAVIGDSAKNAELTQFMQTSSDHFLLETSTPGVGGWGGTCTCPDGTVYQVGDYHNSCASIACINGIPGECGTNNPGGASVQATCAVPPDDTCAMYAWVGGRDCDAGTCDWVDDSPWVYASACAISIVVTLPGTHALTPRLAHDHAQDFEGPQFSVDDPYLHLYSDGRWGTWNGNGRAVGMYPHSNQST